MRSWHIVGDSHISAFRHASQAGLIKRSCRFTEIGGATAVGLRNPNSLTDAVSAFKSALRSSDRETTPVIHLGEVDCGFVIWYRAQKYGDDVEWQFEQSIAAYFDFVDDLLNSGFCGVVITGATVPTIRDGQDWGAIANKRREVQVSLAERTQLTMRYNARLRTEASYRRATFVDIAEHVIDCATGVVSDSYRHPNPANHHLDPAKSGSLWAEKLNGLGCLGGT